MVARLHDAPILVSIALMGAACTSLKDDAPGDRLLADAGVARDADPARDADLPDAEGASPCGTCSSNQVCCASSCVTASEASCFGCGIVCNGSVPVCDVTLRRCACTAASCPGDARCNPVNGACEKCSVVAHDASDFYVDGASPSTGPLGSAQCPFRTITEALAAATASAAPSRTVHVAAGTYNASRGERFPLGLRNGVSLVGSGSKATMIEGVGLHTKVETEYWASFLATVTMSAVDVASDLSGFTIVPGDLSAFTTLHERSEPAPDETNGVFIESGNHPPASSPAAPIPSPSSRLHDLVVGPDFDVGVRIAASEHGANVSVLGSTFYGGSSAGNPWAGAVSVVGRGCGSPWASSETPAMPVSLVVGDSTPGGGNTFVGVGGSSDGQAIYASGCMGQLVVRGNTMTQPPTATAGATAVLARILTEKDVPPPLIVLEGNAVTGLFAGFFVEAPGAMVTAYGNTLSGIRSRNAATATVPAAGFEISAASAGSDYPASVHARFNHFVGNEVGVRIGPLAPTAASVLDFGTDAEGGGNDFRCNSSAVNRAVAGADVWLRAATKDSIYSFIGNDWDRDPPSMFVGPKPANGTDLVLENAPAPLGSVRFSSASLSAQSCPATATP